MTQQQAIEILQEINNLADSVRSQPLQPQQYDPEYNGEPVESRDDECESEYDDLKAEQVDAHEDWGDESYNAMQQYDFDQEVIGHEREEEFVANYLHHHKIRIGSLI